VKDEVICRCDSGDVVFFAWWGRSTIQCGDNLRARGRGPALLDDHIAGGRHSAAGVIAKAQVALSVVLLRAMFNVGYFPLNTPLVE
jgi:hypothetical protein